MQIVQLFLIVGILILFFYVMGQIILFREHEITVEKIVLRSIVGFFIVLAIFQSVCVPMIFLHVKFSYMIIAVSIIYIVLGVLSTIYTIRNKNKICIKKGMSKYEKICVIIFIVLFGIQLYFVLFYDIGMAATDDFVYVVESTVAIESDSMYLVHEITGEPMELNPKRTLNSYNIFVAYLSVITGVSTTVMAHSILPVLWLILSYGVYYLLARYICEKEEVYLYLVILSLLNIFGGYSIYSLSYRLLGPIWQGKAVVMVLALPFLFWLLPRIFTQEFKISSCVLVTVIVMATCSCTLTGAGMALIVIGSMGGLYLLKYRYYKNLIYIASGSFIAGLHVLLYLVLR